MTSSSQRAPTEGEVGSWFRARTKQLKGTFDPGTITEAFKLLPGWSITPSVGLLHLNQNLTSFVEGFIQRRLGAKKYGTVWNDYDDPTLWRLSPSEIISVVQVAHAVKGKVVVTHPVAGTIYSAMAPALDTERGGREMARVWSPAIALPSSVVRAPSGATFEVLEGRGADSFWKWAYGQGLDKAAAALTPNEAEVKAARAAKKATEKGYGYCSVCFGVHAYHDRSNAVVQHGYSMGGGGRGWGHEGMFKDSGDCPGVGWDAWQFSPAGTKSYLSGLKGMLGQAKANLAALREGRVTSLLGIETDEGWPRKKVWRLPSRIDMMAKESKVQTVTPSHPAWDTLLADSIYAAEQTVNGLAADVRWYESAIANWPTIPTAR